MSFTINHTSVTSHNTVCTKEKDYGGSHTEEEHDHEDDKQNFYKFDKDNVHLDEEYQLNEQEIRASRESQTSVGRTGGYHQGDRPPPVAPCRPAPHQQNKWQENVVFWARSK